MLFRLFLLAIVLQLSLTQERARKPTRIEASFTPKGDPQVAVFKCSSDGGKNPSLYFELATGSWKFVPKRLVNEIQPEKKCLETEEDLFQLCKKLYANLDVKNIEYSQQAVVFSAYAKQRALFEKEDLDPVRCLHGAYESKSLFVPADCQFKSLYASDSGCQRQKYWQDKSANECRGMNMILNTSEFLQWCDSSKLNTYSGIEFICCPNIDLNAIIEDEDIDDDGDDDGVDSNGLLDDGNSSFENVKTKDFEAINGDGEEQLRHKNKLSEIDARYENQRAEVKKTWDNERKIAGVDHVQDVDKTYNQKLIDLENAKLEELLREEKTHNDILQSELNEDKYEATLELKNQVEGSTVTLLDDAKKSKRLFAELFNLYEQDRSLQVSIYKRLQSLYPDEAKKQLKQVAENIKLIDVIVNKNKEIMKKLKLDAMFGSVFEREIFGRFKQVQDDAAKIVKEFEAAKPAADVVVPAVEPKEQPNNIATNNNNAVVKVDDDDDDSIESAYNDDSKIDDDLLSSDNDNDDRKERAKAKAAATITTTKKPAAKDYDDDDLYSDETVDNDIDIDDSLDNSDSDSDSKLIDLNQNDPLLEKIQQKGQEALEKQKGAPLDDSPKYKSNSLYKVNGDEDDNDDDDDDDDDDLPKAEKVKKQAAYANVALIVTICAFSLLTVVVLAGILVRRQKLVAKYNKKKGGFMQVDTCSPEEVHVNQMQINGYENPAYKFFEQNQQA